MRAQPTPQERPEPCYRIHMHFTKAVAIFLASDFASSVVDTLMIVSLGLQTGIHTGPVCRHTCACSDGLTRWIRDTAWPASLADGLRTLHVIAAIRDSDRHGRTPVRNHEIG